MTSWINRALYQLTHCNNNYVCSSNPIYNCQSLYLVTIKAHPQEMLNLDPQNNHQAKVWVCYNDASYMVIRSFKLVLLYISSAIICKSVLTFNWVCLSYL